MQRHVCPSIRDAWLQGGLQVCVKLDFEGFVNDAAPAVLEEYYKGTVTSFSVLQLQQEMSLIARGQGEQ